MSTLESKSSFGPDASAAATAAAVAPAANGGGAAPAGAAATTERVKRLIVENLHLEGLTPEMIDENAPLFGEGLGLDSVDALELVVAVEKEFDIKIKTSEIGREVFSSVASLARFIDGRA